MDEGFFGAVLNSGLEVGSATPDSLQVALEAAVRRYESMAGVEAMGIGPLGVARELNSVAADVVGTPDRLVEENRTDSRAAQVVTHVHRFDLAAAASAVLDMAEGEQLQHRDDATVVATRHEDRRVRIGLDLTDRINVGVEMLGTVSTVGSVSGRQLPTQDQRDQHFRIRNSCISDRHVHPTTVDEHVSRIPSRAGFAMSGGPSRLETKLHGRVRPTLATVAIVNQLPYAPWRERGSVVEGAFRWRLGIRPLDLHDWIEMGPDADGSDGWIAEKQRLLADHHPTVFAVLDDVEAVDRGR